jgi:uncharacterized protein
MYADGRHYSWAAAKSEANWRDRGFDFEFASLIVSGPTLERIDTRREYGERRTCAVEVADGIHVAVVFTDRGLGSGDLERRIISARRASRMERMIYESTLKAL